jgi:hypothetical protein
MKHLISTLKYTFITGLVLLLAACGSTPQPTIALSTNAFSQKDLKIGVVYAPPKDKATTHIFGAGCLLCYGVASALTGKLDNHLENTIDNSELIKIKELVLSEYSQRSKNVKFITLPTPIDKLKKFKGELGFAKKDFRGLKETLDIDMIVVLDISRYGAHRYFSNYIPNGDPQGHIAGLLYSVDLNTNAFIQYMRIDEKVQPTGEWDDAPTFPSVTTSYYQAIENSKQKIKDAI